MCIRDRSDSGLVTGGESTFRPGGRLIGGVRTLKRSGLKVAVVPDAAIPSLEPNDRKLTLPPFTTHVDSSGSATHAS